MHAKRKRERELGSTAAGEAGDTERAGDKNMTVLFMCFWGIFVAALPPPPPLLLLLLHQLEELKKASVIEGLGMLCPPSSEQRQTGANLW